MANLHSVEFADVLDRIVAQWLPIAKGVHLVRKDLPGAPTEWCFAPGETELRLLLGVQEDWDRLEDTILPHLGQIPSPKKEETVEIMRILRTKFDLNRRNRHFVGYSGKNDPDGERGRAHFLESMDRTIRHFRKLREELFPSDRKEADSA